MISYIRPATWIYVLHSLQGHSENLKTSKIYTFSKSGGTNSQILGWREPNVFVPSYIPRIGLVKILD